MRASRGMGCIAKDKMPGAKGKTILRKDKPQFVKEYKKGGDVRLLGPSETVNFNKKRVTRQAKKDAYAEGGDVKSKVNAAGNYTKPGKRKALFESIKNSAVQGTGAGQWSARKAQLLAKKYKASGGGYK